MNTITFYINRVLESGKVDFVQESKSALKDAFNLPEGLYQIVIKKIRSIRSTRYKYHFGHVLPMIVETLNRADVHQVLDPLTGDLAPIDTDTLHVYHKQMFNPCLIKNVMRKQDAKGSVPEFIPAPMSTTKLSDGEFIDRYEEQIIDYYSTQYGIEFISRDEFAELCKDGKSTKMIVNERINEASV